MEHFNVFQEFSISKRNVSMCYRNFKYRNGTFQFVPDFFFIKTKRCGQLLKFKITKTYESRPKSQKEKRFYTVLFQGEQNGIFLFDSQIVRNFFVCFIIYRRRNGTFLFVPGFLKSKWNCQFIP